MLIFTNVFPTQYTGTIGFTYHSSDLDLITELSDLPASHRTSFSDNSNTPDKYWIKKDGRHGRHWKV
jgi:hypothetical protein